MQAFIAIKYKSYRRERIRTGIQTDNRLMRMIYVALFRPFRLVPETYFAGIFVWCSVCAGMDWEKTIYPSVFSPFM